MTKTAPGSAADTVDGLLAVASDLPRHEAERLLMAATGLDRARLLLAGPLPDNQVHRFANLADRRRAGEPLQYLEGTVAFGPITLRVDPRALIPRPETERLWELATELVAGPQVIVDLCTGSGNLALACAQRWPGARVLATDTSATALSLAKENAATLGLAVEVLEGDLFAPMPPDLAGRIDLVVANPPYLARAELATVAGELHHEPVEALVAGTDGIEVVARIGAEVGKWLAPGGVAVVEVSARHAVRACGLFAGVDAAVHPDLTGRPRFVVAVAVAG
ncbi:MAG: peptide chain release factor N(5)-glutamine methyltransferase [Actinomycetota bacterium]|nr:peptide chain release factor N(5)-glutamine methyltransferase [Actinomycetota bacterium]